MRQPHFLPKNGTIGFCAPSFGSPTDPYRARLENAKNTYERLGHTVVLSDEVFTLEKGQSADKKTRAEAFMAQYFDASIDLIHSVAGGERMLEILPYVDFNAISQAKPKWFMGYSDNTTLTFTLTTLSNVQTLYGPCAHDFGMEPWDESIHDVYALMRGLKKQTENYPLYEIEDAKKAPGMALSPYNVTEATKLNQYQHEGDIEEKGILLGGCLDILVSLVGTPYDQVKTFVEQHKETGIIWVLETADLNPIGTLRALWQLKAAGWFTHAKGFLFGRPAFQGSYFDVSFDESVLAVIDEGFIITGVDVGHLAPQMGFIHGATAKVIKKATTLSIHYTFKE